MFVDYGRRPPLGTLADAVGFYRGKQRGDTGDVSRESPPIIVVDLVHDDNLRMWAQQATSIIASGVVGTTVEARAAYLAHFVASKLGDVHVRASAPRLTINAVPAVPLDDTHLATNCMTGPRHTRPSREGGRAHCCATVRAGAAPWVGRAAR